MELEQVKDQIIQDKKENPKKKRGRPRKTESDKTKALPTTNASFAGHTPKPDTLIGGHTLNLTFKNIFIFIGHVLANAYKDSLFKLQENESVLLADQANDCMNSFAPNIDSKWLKLGVLVTSFTGIFGKKFLEHESKKPKKKKEDNKQLAKPVQPHNPNVTVHDGIQ